MVSSGCSLIPRYMDIVKPGSANQDPLFSNQKLPDGNETGYPGGEWGGSAHLVSRSSNGFTTTCYDAGVHGQIEGLGRSTPYRQGHWSSTAPQTMKQVLGRRCVNLTRTIGGEFIDRSHQTPHQPFHLYQQQGACVQASKRWAHTKGFDSMIGVILSLVSSSVSIP